MVETVIEKAEKARELLIQATQILSEIVEGEKTPETEDWAENRLEFWSRILLEGGIVSETKAHEIWEKEMKNDPRGYGGNFTGKKPSLQYTHDNKVILTATASEKCKAWKGIPLTEYAKRFKKK